MQYKAFERGIEISGHAVASTLQGFQLFPSVALKYLARYGFIKGPLPAEGKQPWPDIIDRNAWFPQENWLATFEAIGRDVGTHSLYRIGLCIPEVAKFPPAVHDIYTGVESIDIAYHMNHRKAGKVMFDPKTRLIENGIGHYGYRPVAGEKKIISVCENPYPCDFDHGILTAMARRFEPKVTVAHDDLAPCRKKGADSCTYLITWSVPK
ncbi:hypothetical protein LZC95_29805 [Pendulispora brunnea]|uniref:4-vinyl reductase 4VR domain-containing protein n=1 Tax=Pendulispora brunnea TaxID=2905690 RepID=A0ABZ2JXX4_9BACT